MDALVRAFASDDDGVVLAVLWTSLALMEMLAVAAMSTMPVMPPRMPKKTR